MYCWLNSKLDFKTDSILIFCYIQTVAVLKYHIDLH